MIINYKSLTDSYKNTFSNRKGFTLVEIMVIVAIIAVLATLAISMMLRNRITTNETVAVASCRIIISACQSYYSVTLPHTYPPSLAALGEGAGTGPSYIDTPLASGSKAGYNFTYQLTSPVTFVLYAEPAFYRRTGNRYFYADETGRITAREGGRAGPGDPAF